MFTKLAGSKKKRTKMLNMNVPKDPESQLQMSHIGYSRLAQFHLTRRSRKSFFFFCFFFEDVHA